MKNAEKTPAQPKAAAKPRTTTAKKPQGAAVKKPRTVSAKKPRSGGKRRKKPGSSDALRAVLLTGVLIAVSGFISTAVIVVHSTVTKTAPGGVPGVPPIVQPAPLSLTPPEPPVEQAAPSSATPAQPAEQPAPPGAAPAQPAERPAPSSAAPAQPAEQPAPPGAAPAQPAERPAPSSAAPAQPPEHPAPPNAAPTRPAERPVPPKAAPARPVKPSVPPITVSVQPAERPAPVSVIPARTAAPPERPEQPKPERRGTLVFVIDDAGNNLKELEPFLRFPGPLTIAVLPGLPHSAEAARRIRAAGKEVFLHQPMEAVGGQAPGPGAIYAGMNAEEIRAVLKRNVTEIGPIAGMNNHQGSKITMDRKAMETVLAFCREEGLYFLDSKTIAETAVPAAARALGITIGERDVFIDNEQNKETMTRYIKEGLTRSEQRGSAVMIGHTWSPALAPLLAELYPDLIKQGYSLNTASGLIAGRTK